MKNELEKQQNIEFMRTDFVSVLNKYQYNLNLGDIVAGFIFSLELQGALVDVGDGHCGFLPTEEFSIIHDTTVNIKVKVNREFFILARDIYSSQLILSVKRLEYLRAWKRIQQLQKEDVIIYISIIGQNQGGLLVNFDGIQGFLPNSHIIDLTFKEAMVNTIIPSKLLIVDEKSNKLLFSHRCAVLSLSSFVIGNIISAKVIRIKKYGIFVKAQNVQALLHISEIPKSSDKKLALVFTINEYLQVVIVHIDKKQGRLSVSINRFLS